MDQPVKAEANTEQRDAPVNLLDRVARPPMRIVWTGWTCRPDEEATVEELIKADLEEAERRKRRRGLFRWW